MAAVVLVFATASAHAAEPEVQAAQRWFDAGRGHVRAGRCDLAVDAFKKSLAASRNVGALLNLGECLETLGQLQEAYEVLRDAQALAAERRDERLTVARASAERVESRVVRVVVNVPPDARDVVIEIDGVVVPRMRWSHVLVAPNAPHALVARANGDPPMSREITGRAGELVEVTVPPSVQARAAEASPAGARDPDSSSRPVEGTSTMKVTGLAVAGAGVAAIVTGSVLGLLALSARSDLEQAVVRDPRCVGGYPNGACDPSARRDIDPLADRASGLATTSTIFFVSGLAVVGAGVALVLLAPSSRATSSGVRIVPALAGASVGGTF